MTTTRALALFDFDGTITTRDTMFDFVRATRGPVRLALGLVALSPWLVAHKLGLLGATPAKVLVLRWFFGGESRETLARWGEAYVDRVEALIRPGAARRLGWHVAAGHDVAVVSASLDLWVGAWARKRGLRLLCTEAAWDGDVFAGALGSANCNGAEKERRIRAAFDVTAYATVYAYGDSSGDAEMLALATEPSFKPFRDDAAPAPAAAGPVPTDRAG